MPRKHQGALTIQLTPDDWETATRSKSNSCLLADAIAKQYPHLARVRVDVATIRATDTRTDDRLTWVTPYSAQQLLLHFDQGWNQPDTLKIVTRRPAHVAPMTRSPAQIAQRAARAADRLVELEQKEAAGTLTKHDQAALTRHRNPKPPKPRPASRGRSTAVQHRDGSGTVMGGNPPPVTSDHPNMLAGRDRQYGARKAKPDQVFANALHAEVGLALPDAVALEIARMREAGEL